MNPHRVRSSNTTSRAPGLLCHTRAPILPSKIDSAVQTRVVTAKGRWMNALNPYATSRGRATMRRVATNTWGA